MSEGSRVTFKPKGNNTIRILKNIWGPGSLVIGGSVSMEASIGTAADNNLLTKECWSYNADNVVEEI